MFKIGKLNNIPNESITIEPFEVEMLTYDDGKKTIKSNKSLSFDIEAATYSLYFELNCNLVKLLELTRGEEVDLKDYIQEGETFFKYNGKQEQDPNMDIKIIRYLDHKFIISATITTNYRTALEDDYCAMIEIDFDIEEYLN